MAPVGCLDMVVHVAGRSLEMTTEHRRQHIIALLGISFGIDHSKNAMLKSSRNNRSVLERI